MHLRKYAYYTERFEPKVFVANIEPNSPFIISENINVGDIICKINGIKINTLDDINKIVNELSDNQYITIETHNNYIDTITKSVLTNKSV